MKKSILSVMLLLVSFSSFGNVNSSIEVKHSDIEFSEFSDDQFDREYSNSSPQSDLSELNDDEVEKDSNNSYLEIKSLVINKV